MTFPHTHPALVGTLTARGYLQPTPVQSAVLEKAASGDDLLVSAQTGSGKTVAFGLAMAPDLLGDAEMLPPPGAPLALVIAPTRELAMQVHAELTWLYADVGGKVLACVGGMDPRREQRLLYQGCHIVVGTPGRLRDHINRRQLDSSALRVVVLDEADEMLDLGFREELEFVLDAAPEERRTLLFSATFPHEIVSLANRFQKNALRLTVGSKDEPHKDITYTALNVANGETTPAVINVLRYYDARLAIVFCPTREAVRAMWTALNARGFLAVALSGEMAQGERNQALLALRAGRARVCVATDVAARGLDLPELSLVVHAEIPMNAQLLLHRSGRTGRAGKQGASVIMVTASRRRRAQALLEQAKVSATWGPVPDADQIRRRDNERLLSDTILTEAADEDELAAAVALTADRDAQSIAVALLRLYRASLPEEETVTRILPEPERPKRTTTRAATPREGRSSRNSVNDPVWLSASVGRRDKADPKWLLPLLCRIGEVTRDEIGAIRILTSETRFEVSGAAADQFLGSFPLDKGGEIHIASSRAPTESEHSGKPPRRSSDTNRRAPERRYADGPKPTRSKSDHRSADAGAKPAKAKQRKSR